MDPTTYAISDLVKGDREWAVDCLAEALRCDKRQPWTDVTKLQAGHLILMRREYEAGRLTEFPRIGR
jgi:hypothetical protein